MQPQYHQEGPNYLGLKLKPLRPLRGPMVNAQQGGLLHWSAQLTFDLTNTTAATITLKFSLHLRCRLDSSLLLLNRMR